MPHREEIVLERFVCLLAERGIEVTPGDPSLLAFPEFSREREEARRQAEARIAIARAGLDFDR